LRLAWGQRGFLPLLISPLLFLLLLILLRLLLLGRRKGAVELVLLFLRALPRARGWPPRRLRGERSPLALG